MSQLRRILMEQKQGSEPSYIVFADPEVARILAASGIGDGVGITIEEARATTSLPSFRYSTITSFEELQYFGVLVFEIAQFGGISTLTSIALPPSVKTIGQSAFENSSAVVVEELDLPNLESMQGVPFGWGDNIGIKFRKIVNLGKVTTLTTISNIGTFQAQNLLTEVTLPTTMQNIPMNTFKNCTSLTSVHLNEGLTQLLWCCFEGCSALPEIDLPSTVTTLDVGTFINCTNLRTIVCRAATPPSVGSQAFSGCPLTNIYVPDSSVDAYKGAGGWGGYASIIKPISQYNG